MKVKYTAPEFEQIVLDAKDIITASDLTNEDGIVLTPEIDF